MVNDFPKILFQDKLGFKFRDNLWRTQEAGYRMVMVLITHRIVIWEMRQFNQIPYFSVLME
jgi:hypothetical protein